MGRPERHDVDYFPFFAKKGRTLNILQSRYGLEGIGFFTNLMRFLALTPDHYYCVKDEMDKMNFFAEIGIEENKGVAMIELMVKTEKLDKELWENHKVIVSGMFLESLKEAYKQRKNEIITIGEILEKFQSIHGNSENIGSSEVSIHGNAALCGFPCEISSHNPQSKVKKRKVKKSKEDTEASPPAFPDNPSPSKPEKPKKVPLREREPVNDMERVEKAYLTNWDSLYSQKRVQTPEPVITDSGWKQIRSLLKQHFEKRKLKPEQIILAINNGLNDGWVMQRGYSLALMLKDTVINGLINGNGSGPPKHRIAADNVSQEKSSSYFREAK